MTRSHAFEEISRVDLARDLWAALFTCMVHLTRFRLKNPGVLDDCQCSTYGFVPSEVDSQVNAELLSTVSLFQGVSMAPVIGYSLKGLFELYSDYLTLL